MTSPTNLRSEQIKSEFAFERQVQDSAPSAEWSDLGRDLANFPKLWWLRYVVWGTLLGLVGAVFGIIIIAEMLGPHW